MGRPEPLGSERLWKVPKFTPGSGGNKKPWKFLIKDNLIRMGIRRYKTSTEGREHGDLDLGEGQATP